MFFYSHHVRIDLTVTKHLSSIQGQHPSEKTELCNFVYSLRGKLSTYASIPPLRESNEQASQVKLSASKKKMTGKWACSLAVTIKCL